MEVMCHPFFDEIKENGKKMLNGKDMPELFDFSIEGIEF